MDELIEIGITLLIIFILCDISALTVFYLLNGA